MLSNLHTKKLQKNNLHYLLDFQQNKIFDNKLTTHQAASFVIARRGLLIYERYINKSTEIKKQDNNIVCRKIERKLITVVNKEKTISIRRSQYYPFDLPVRNNQKQDGIYWKEIEKNYHKVKKHRNYLKRKKLILENNSSKLLSSETTLVADSFGVNRDSSPTLLFFPF